ARCPRPPPLPAQSCRQDRSCPVARSKKFRPDATGRNACTWIAAGSPAHFAEQNAALRLGGRLRFNDFHHHRLSRNGEILHHLIGDVLDQRALRTEGAAFDGVDVDFRHVGLPFCASPRGTIAAAPNIGRRGCAVTASAEEAESALARVSATPIVTLAITRAESATAIVALTIAPRSPVVGAHLAPPNALGSPRLAPAPPAPSGCVRLPAACRGLRPAAEAARPRRSRRTPPRPAWI